MKLIVLSNFQSNKKNYSAAEQNFKTSLRINNEVKNHLNYSETAIELGKLYKLTDEIEKANYYFDLAEKFYRRNKIHKELNTISQFRQT